MVHKLDADRLHGRLMILEGRLDPARLIPPHTHTREDECSFVLAGDVTFQVGADVFTATAGSYVVKPRGEPHALWNAGSKAARVMEIHVPATLGAFYDELAEVVTDPAMSGEQRREAQEALHARYGLIFHWERVPELAERYGVHP
jgi:mannose-6-phosphate isomerase-like protein (cupin superfamily)